VSGQEVTLALQSRVTLLAADLIKLYAIRMMWWYHLWCHFLPTLHNQV